MSFCVHIHVVFPCSDNDPVAKLARECLATFPTEMRDGVREARWFLESLAGRTGSNPGPNGGLSLWGLVGNYTDGEVFCEALMSFWGRLLGSGNDEADVPLYFERVLVFVECQQSEATTVYQIGRRYGDEGAPIEVTAFEDLPFSAGQF